MNRPGRPSAIWLSWHSTLTSKGQVTIPAEIRQELGLKAKDKLNFTVLPDGTVIMRAKTRSIIDLAGHLTAPEGVHVSVEEMKADNG